MLNWLALTILAFAPLSGERWEPPPAPAAIQPWLDRGRVRWEFYDAEAEPRERPATTHYDLRYHYRWRGRWGVVRRGRRRELVVRPIPTRIELEVEHRIELPGAYRRDDLFSIPLVRHELDHVRISSDPRLQDLFERWVREVDEVRHRLAPGEHVDAELVQQVVTEAVETRFRRIGQLVEIRYRELDRLTRHGRNALPPGFHERALDAEADEANGRR